MGWPVKVQLGPRSGSSAWIRGSVDAWVVMRSYGLEAPIGWEFPTDIRYLDAANGWPFRAIWGELQEEKDYRDWAGIPVLRPYLTVKRKK
jgi:hypothetical protein